MKNNNRKFDLFNINLCDVRFLSIITFHYLILLKYYIKIMYRTTTTIK